MFFQLLTNGWLTGRGIVRYDSAADPRRPRRITFLGDGRLVWAPVEDLLFGFALVLLTCAGWVRAGAGVRPLPPPLTGTAVDPYGAADRYGARRAGRLATARAWWRGPVRGGRARPAGLRGAGDHDPARGCQPLPAGTLSRPANTL